MSDRPLLALGLFVFSIDTLAYAELQRRVDWRHAKSERHGARPATQFLGPGDDKISLSGTLVPELAGSYSSLNRLRAMGDTGDAWPLLDGSGTQLGVYRIAAVDERQAAHVAGGWARKIDFALDLERVD